MGYSIFFPTFEVGPPYIGPLAGVRRYTYSLINALSLQSVEVFVATTTNLPKGDELLKRDNVHFYIIPTKISSRGIYSSKTHFFGKNRKIFSEKAFELYRELSKKESFDLIHTTEVDGYSFAMAKKKDLLQSPLVMSTHSPVSTGTWKSNWFVQRPYRSLLSKIVPYFDMIITPSRSLLKKLGKLTKKIEKKVKVVPLAIDCTKFSKVPKIEEMEHFRQKYHLEENKRVILILGPFIPRKAPIKAIDYLPRLLERKPDVNFLIVGNGPLLSNIKEKVIENKIDEDVIITGYIPDVELYVAYHISDLLLYTAEGGTFGTPIIEAMASGLKTIAVDTSPMNEILPPKCRWLYPSNDYSKMVDIIIELLSKGEKDSDIIFETQKYALENYNYPVVGKKLVKLYSELLT